MSACPYCNLEHDSLDVHWAAECKHAPGFVKAQADLMVRRFGVAGLVAMASNAAGVPYGPRSDSDRSVREHDAARPKRAKLQAEDGSRKSKTPGGDRDEGTPRCASPPGDPFGIDEEDDE